jgi:hypothetical protein
MVSPVRSWCVHILDMSIDISDLLEQWDYVPGQVVVRKFRGKNGLDKIQLRVDLGLLQMNATGRPDGKRPFGQESLLEHYQEQLATFLREQTSAEIRSLEKWLQEIQSKRPKSPS